MSKKKVRIEEPDKYDGTDLAKQRLLNLFLYTEGNINEFCQTAKNYREYFVKTLNLLEEDRKVDCLPYYCDISNRVLKITEIDNILTLNRLLFNVLSAFDAFIGYISKEIKQLNYNELSDLIDVINPLLATKTIGTLKDIDLLELLHESRNALIHSGSYICKFATVPSGTKDMFVPALVIIPSKILNEKYCKEHNIGENYCIDVYEVFNAFLESLSNIDIKKILHLSEIKSAGC